MDQKDEELLYSLTVPLVLCFLLCMYSIIIYRRRNELPTPSPPIIVDQAPGRLHTIPEEIDL